jgi:hypothetical protein
MFGAVVEQFQGWVLPVYSVRDVPGLHLAPQPHPSPGFS